MVRTTAATLTIPEELEVLINRLEEAAAVLTVVAAVEELEGLINHSEEAAAVLLAVVLVRVGRRGGRGRR